MTARIALVAAIALALLGCEKDTKRKLDPKDFPTSIDDPPILRVSAPGSGELRELRLVPNPDTSQNMRMKMAMKGGPMNMEMDARLKASVTKIHDDGSYDVEATFEKVDMSNSLGVEVSSIVEEMLTDVKSVTTMTPRGASKTTLDMGADVPLAGINQSFEQLGFNLPEEAVGAGATWTTKETVEYNGIKLYQEVTYEVLELSGNTARMKMTITQDAPKQSMDMMGQSIEVESLTSSGSGTLELDFSKGMPTKMDLSVKSKTKMKAGGHSESASVEMTIEMSEV